MRVWGPMQVNLKTVNTRDLRDWMSDIALELRVRASMKTDETGPYIKLVLDREGFVEAVKAYRILTGTTIREAGEFVQALKTP